MKENIKTMLRPVKFHLDFLLLAVFLFKAIIRSNRDYRFRLRLVKVWRLLVEKLEDKNQNVIKTTTDSFMIYEKYDDRDIRDEQSNVTDLMLPGNKVELIELKERRENHLQYLYHEIDQILMQKMEVSILEVGCGNLSNAEAVRLKYGNKVKYGGIEISPNRIDFGLKAFKNLEKEKFSVQSITEKTSFKDNEFDIVFSMHCLEQIAYDAERAVAEMNRISKNLIVMIEPVFENGNFLQRTYLMLSDHTRILLQSIQKLGLNLTKNEICNMQTNLENQSTLLVVSKSIVPQIFLR
jgi:SAM-dependent methyltransferase